MSRLYKYITETESNIQIDCSEFIKERAACGDFLYHASKHSYKTNTYYDFKPRPNPKDTLEYVHEYVNEYYKKKLGIPLRTHSMFCFIEESPTSFYGKPYVIIPTNGYKIFQNSIMSDQFNGLKPAQAMDEVLNLSYDAVEKIIITHLKKLDSELNEIELNSESIKLKQLRTVISPKILNTNHMGCAYYKYDKKLILSQDHKIEDKYKLDSHKVLSLFIEPLYKTFQKLLETRILSKTKEIALNKVNYNEVMLYCKGFYLLDPKDEYNLT